MSVYRVFYRRFRLSAKEEAKLREYQKNRQEHHGQVTIRYTKTKRIKDVEAESLNQAEYSLERSELELIPDMPHIRKQYAVVYGVVNKPECIRHHGEIETFTAEQVNLL